MGQQLLVRSGGGSPFICPRGAPVDRLLGSFQVRPPQRRGRGKEGLLDVRGGAASEGGHLLLLSAFPWVQDHHGGRGGVGKWGQSL